MYIRLSDEFTDSLLPLQFARKIKEKNRLEKRQMSVN